MKVPRSGFLGAHPKESGFGDHPGRLQGSLLCLFRGWICKVLQIGSPSAEGASARPQIVQLPEAEQLQEESYPVLGEVAKCFAH